MGRVALILAVVVFVASLLTGCGCLAADSYEKSACRKYRTNWGMDRIYNEE